jgi:hypothetical protein
MITNTSQKVASNRKGGAKNHSAFFYYSDVTSVQLQHYSSYVLINRKLLFIPTGICLLGPRFVMVSWFDCEPLRISVQFCIAILISES